MTPRKRRSDGSQYVTIDGLPGFRFILKPDEQFAPPLQVAIEQFLSLYLPAFAAHKVAKAAAQERERIQSLIFKIRDKENRSLDWCNALNEIAAALHRRNGE